MHGKPLGSQVGPATVFENWIDDAALTPYRIVLGRPPRADGEIALNVAAVEQSGARVGDHLTVVGQFGPQPYLLVGSFTSGAAKSASGAISVEFTLREMQRLAGTRGQIDSVYVVGARGLGQHAVVTRLQATLRGVEVITGKEAVSQLAQGASSELQFLQMILVVFGVVALLVGAFVISNTFTILVAQRTRELALLRALGASRAQVFGSVLLEAAIVGVVAALGGLVLGSYLATWINRGLHQIGAQLPAKSLVVRPDTIVLSLVMGVSVTLLAALLPALRATRVSPLAALREVSVDRSHASSRRVVVGVVLLLVGGLGCSEAWRRQGAAGAMPSVGAGAVLVIVGVIVVGPLLAGRTVGLPGPPLAWLKGVTGRIATENAVRSPRRTSTTASAVLISVALVVFVSAFAASATQSVEADARRGFAGDFIVTGSGGLSLPNGLLVNPIPPTVVDAVRAVKGVRLVAGIGYSNARITYPDGALGTHFVSSVDAAGLGTVLRPRMTEGDIHDLNDGGIVVDRVIVHDHHLSVGDHLTYAVNGGSPVRLRIVGISDDPNLLGFFTITRHTYASVAPQVRDVRVGGLIQPGADLREVLAGVRLAIASTPTVVAFDRTAFIGNLRKQIDAFVNVIYGLLILSVVISVLGIANTLSLTIHERTSELGLLRALGMDRAEIRSAVRWEAVLITTFGMAVGLLVGTLVSMAVVRSMRGFGLVAFAMPPRSLVVIGIGAVAFGGLASVRPARRAAGVSILDAIAAD